MRDAVALIAKGSAPRITQPEHGASYEDMLNKKHLTVINFENLNGKQLHDFIRGMDKVPGASLTLNGEDVKVFGSRRYGGRLPAGVEAKVTGMKRPALITTEGLFLFANDDEPVCVQKVQLSSGRMINASKYGQIDEAANIELTDEELEHAKTIEKIWSAILRIHIEPSTDFFKSGAGSLDVTRLVEEIKEQCQIELENEDVYMATVFDEFIKATVLKSRGGGSSSKLEFTPVTVQVTAKRSVSFATQLFINNQFVDAEQKKTFPVINPADESVLCSVQCAGKEDVDKAVNAAQVRKLINLIDFFLSYEIIFNSTVFSV